LFEAERRNRRRSVTAVLDRSSPTSSLAGGSSATLRPSR
jgi:hypothetical protein